MATRTIEERVRQINEKLAFYIHCVGDRECRKTFCLIESVHLTNSNLK